MSEKKDERDIDEILASIDQMLAEKDNFPLLSETPRESKKKASASSKKTKSASSPPVKTTKSKKLKSFEPLDKTKSKPQKAKALVSKQPLKKKEVSEESVKKASPKRIILTEEHLEPSAQESLPLWVAQSTSQDEPANDNEALDTLHQIEDLAHTNPSQKHKQAPRIAPKKTETDSEESFDAVFNAIANDNTITFDMSEAMDEDTVFDVLDKELVEAFVHDVVEEDSQINEYTLGDNHNDKKEKTPPRQAQSESDGKAIEENDTATKLDHSVHKERNDETISLNPDELDPLIELISDDVRIKINQHLQQILPELISDALLEHLANQRDED